ncbi:hypothetical protein ACFQ3J_04105 [Paenibacillus provencensis]|uniref:ABC-2 family transporter protein n=1 Tax=Paenibacillus provencensis TaxID=441151 RepID=A0ABW3PSW9_9BACL|nr:hypothetical protein [Paenibacillus sp. MER 78]MCM3126838.1 hypothetical protein [Paenibacillus sp. MER 78]
MWGIKGYELRKVLKAPVFPILLVIFILWNVFLIWPVTYIKEDLKLVNELAAAYGVEMDEAALAGLGQKAHELLGEMNTVTESRTEQSYETAASFFEQANLTKYVYNQPGLYDDEELQMFHQARLIEHYYTKSQTADTVYKQLDVQAYAEGAMELYGVSGSPAEYIRTQFAALGERLVELIDNEEHKQLFFDGGMYRMHSTLFETLFGGIAIELMVFAVLITGMICKYETEQRSEHVVYSTRRGRKLMRDKLAASLTGSFISGVLLITASLGVYFIMADYSGLWNVSMSSIFVSDKNFPYIPWWDLSFLQYLLLVILIFVIAQLMFSSLAFIISIFVRNSYFVFAVFALCLGIIVGWRSFIPSDHFLILASVFNPFHMILEAQYMFMGQSIFRTYKWYELITLMSWTILLAFGVLLSMLKFRKQGL